MHICAVLNCDSGTCRTMDVAAFTDRLKELAAGAGHTVEVHTVAGGQAANTMAEAVQRSDVDVLLAAGGDGTVSLAAGLVAGSGKVLGIVPAGTMNLYARSLQIPLDPDAAAAALIGGVVRDVDVACANGKPFVHQFSLGIHPQLVQLRSGMKFRSRVGKIMASARAAIATLLNPRRIKAALNVDGKELLAVSPSITVTNNLYGEGHLPYADAPDGGVLGVYITRTRRPLDLIKHLFHMALGHWEANPQVDIFQGREVRIEVSSKRLSRLKCALDGELHPLEPAVEIRTRPRSLRVLVPREPEPT